MSLFAGKVAIVTGAASGIGLGLAREISKQGGRVAMIDIDIMRLDKATVDFPPGTYEKKIADVTNFEALKKCFSEIKERFGKIDYLFNNAGIGGTLPFGEATLEQWRRIVDLNLYGVIHGMMAMLPIMKEQNEGYIVNTSSIAGIIPFPGQTLYNTTKYAVTGLSLTVEKELLANNISISIVCPGMVNTRIFYKPIIGPEAPEEYVKIPKEAISVDSAVSDIVKGILKRRKIIITPGFLRGIYLRYRMLGKI